MNTAIWKRCWTARQRSKQPKRRETLINHRAQMGCQRLTLDDKMDLPFTLDDLEVRP
jgi:hypothetical protein